MTADEDELALIPRAVRDKLDRVGVKLHLRQWEQLGLDERRLLRDRPCGSVAEIAAYAAELEQLIRRRTGAAPDRLRR
jgi:hypothetical protein